MTIHNLPELLDRCSETFQPKSLDDFIGMQANQKGSGARLVAQQIQNAVTVANANGRRSIRFLLSGDAGIGKSLLVKWIMHLTGANKWNTTKLNGTSCKVEVIDRLAYEYGLSNLFGDWRLLQIDEADYIPTVAQVKFLTFLDDLPPGIIVVCTSNRMVKNFEDRFQSRFQALQVNAPTAEEILSLLQRYIPNDPDAVNIAQFACGNVRQALMDVKGLVDNIASQPQQLAA